MLNYVGIIHKDKTSDYGISFPDLPGCVTAGSTLDELYEMAVDAASLWLEVHLEMGGEIPVASTVDEVKASFKGMK